MIHVTTAFRQALSGGNRDYQTRVEVTLKDGTVLSFDNTKIWSDGCEKEDAVSSDSSFAALGSAAVGSYKFTVNNASEQYSSYEFMSATVKAYVALDVGGATPEEIQLGEYIVDDPKYRGSTILLSCLDNMSRFDKPYDSNLVYPASLNTILRDACTKCGVTLSSLIFPRDDYVVSTKPTGDSLTYRDVVAACAAVSGCFAKCDHIGQLELRWFDTDALTYGTAGKFYDIPKCFSLDVSSDDVVITQVQVEVKTDEAGAGGKRTYTLGNAGYTVAVKDCVFINESNAQEFVNFLGQKLIGVRFRKASLTHPSDPTMEAGDVARIHDRKGHVYPILITRTNFKVGARQTTVCGAETPARNSSTRFSEMTKNYVDLRKRLQVQKEDYETRQAELAERIENAGGLYKTEEVQEDLSVITYYHNKPNLEDSDIRFVINDEAVSVTSDGGEHWYGLRVNGDMITRILNTIGINAGWINSGQLVVKKGTKEVLFVDCATGAVRICADSFSLSGGSTIDSIAQEKADEALAQAVTSVVIQYAQGNSSTTAPTSGWSEDSPTWAADKYIWQRTVTTKNGQQTISNVTCIQGAKGDTGGTGERGTSTLKLITTEPTAYTTKVDDYTPAYRVPLADVELQTGVSPIVGDIIEFGYYHYPVGLIKDNYVYLGNKTSIRGATGAAGADAVTLRIDSSRGVVFKNNVFDTVLSAVIIKGGTTITDIAGLRSVFGNGAYLQWYYRKTTDETWSVLSSTDPHLSQDGFQLTITPDDVDETLTFQCDLET